MLIKKICFFGAIFLATPLLMAQYKLSGTIKDSDNKEPLKNERERLQTTKRAKDERRE